jgi:putative tryptophan/tyrosine transport system substrate-binding protein
MRTLVIALALAVLSVTGQAQAQPTSPPRLGYLSLGTERSPQAAFRAAFLSGLLDLSYIEGRNIAIEYRYAEGRADRLPGLARELVQSSPDVLVGEGIQASLALKSATISIPTVTLSCDAVAAGLVREFARPGGNITGVTCITSEVAAKRMQILQEIKPELRRVGILWNASDPAKASEAEKTQTAAEALGMTVRAYDVRAPEDFAKTFSAMRSDAIEALSTTGDSFMIFHRELIVGFAAAQRIPAAYPFRDFVEAGGLMSYGPSLAAMYRGMAPYVHRILRGARPGDIPIEQPTKFELIVNLNTAKALGLTVPDSLLSRADEVIE